MDRRRLRLASVPPAGGTDGVEEKIVRALTYPKPRAEERPGRMRRVNLGDLQTALGETDLKFAVVLVDDSGRISGRPVFEHLLWSAGNTFTAWAGRGHLMLRPTEEGPLSLDGRGRMALPPTLLRYCGIDSGDQAFLIAAPDHQALIVHPLINLAHMVRTFHTDLYDREIQQRISGLDH
ncbi:hypothetical protein ALI22I_07560 [Saccharothrix sp. ALI-22-I]|uniref:hypothetical protein n=1 Tax=Saccharothrix sp. ALI-22-I TaxID=1933778 RepID=UPI00097BFAA8|nr:hypothetical protein [Saccharothrix sp. ALI-22-I]ONI91717.1 hypothetical protein ALI22I_07560 [Saccharothrix sp. ALI-22-I]